MGGALTGFRPGILRDRHLRSRPVECNPLGLAGALLAGSGQSAGCKSNRLVVAVTGAGRTRRFSYVSYGGSQAASDWRY